MSTANGLPEDTARQVPDVFWENFPGRTLRDLCRRTREFEDFFLERYRGFLLAELNGDQARAAFALDRIAATPFGDGAMRRQAANAQRRLATQ